MAADSSSFVSDQAHQVPSYTAAGQAVARAMRDDYGKWLEHVGPAGGCTRPIRLSGRLDTVDSATGRIVKITHTDSLPDGAIYKACGNRRSTVCPCCARTYQVDAYQLLRAGIIGGKGVPETIAQHPAVFATVTAPSFGTVHTRTVRQHTCASRRRCDCRPDPCHARRNTGTCRHGRAAVCWSRHDSDDPALGQPMCLDCYDYEGQAVWNISTGELWRRTKQTAERLLATLCRERGIRFHRVSTGTGQIRYLSPVRLSHGKAAEMQRRGAIHFHAMLRLDGVDPGNRDAIVAPPDAITVDDVAAAIRTAAAHTNVITEPHPDRPAGWHIAWGEQVDARPVTLAIDGEVTNDMVAAYLAKYATKATEITGHTSTRINDGNVDQHADPGGDHTARLIAACWRLGRPTSTPVPLSSRPGPDRPTTDDRRTPFDNPWTCDRCLKPTRYAACPTCRGQRQGGLDSQSPRTMPVNPYARLRRWAHMLGYGGHFLTKARRYSTTFAAIRTARTSYRRQQDHVGPHPATTTAVDEDQAATFMVGSLSYVGSGWHTNGDALLANTAAAMARDRRLVGREETAREPVATNPPLAT